MEKLRRLYEAAEVVRKFGLDPPIATTGAAVAFFAVARVATLVYKKKLEEPLFVVAAIACASSGITVLRWRQLQRSPPLASDTGAQANKLAFPSSKVFVTRGGDPLTRVVLPRLYYECHVDVNLADWKNELDKAAAEWFRGAAVAPLLPLVHRDVGAWLACLRVRPFLRIPKLLLNGFHLPPPQLVVKYGVCNVALIATCVGGVWALTWENVAVRAAREHMSLLTKWLPVTKLLPVAVNVLQAFIKAPTPWTVLRNVALPLGAPCLVVGLVQAVVHRLQRPRALADAACWHDAELVVELHVATGAAGEKDPALNQLIGAASKWNAKVVIVHGCPDRDLVDDSLVVSTYTHLESLYSSTVAPFVNFPFRAVPPDYKASAVPIKAVTDLLPPLAKAAVVQKLRLRCSKMAQDCKARALTDDERVAVVAYTSDVRLEGGRNEANLSYKLTTALLERDDGAFRDNPALSDFYYYVTCALGRLPLVQPDDDGKVWLFRAAERAATADDYPVGWRVCWPALTLASRDLDTAFQFGQGTLFIIDATEARTLAEYSIGPPGETILLPTSVFKIMGRYHGSFEARKNFPGLPTLRDNRFERAVVVVLKQVSSLLQRCPIRTSDATQEKPRWFFSGLDATGVVRRLDIEMQVAKCLDESAASVMILVAGPPGFGKSTIAKSIGTFDGVVPQGYYYETLWAKGSNLQRALLRLCEVLNELSARLQEQSAAILDASHDAVPVVANRIANSLRLLSNAAAVRVATFPLRRPFLVVLDGVDDDLADQGARCMAALLASKSCDFILTTRNTAFCDTLDDSPQWISQKSFPLVQVRPVALSDAEATDLIRAIFGWPAPWRNTAGLL